jgi:hypothetical protein
MDLSADIVMYHLVSYHGGDDYFSIACSEQGRGLFANVNIPAKTIIMTVPMPLLQQTVSTYTQQGLNGIINLRDAQGKNGHKALFLNHSDSPNISVNAFGHAIAINHIFNGEELLINYDDMPRNINL